LKERRWAALVWVFFAYAVLAAVQAWPLPLHLSTHLTGAPGGDTGVYVWNLWVFKHQLIETQTTPFSTLTILPLDGPTDLSLHNYTVFADVLALPLLSWLGVVRTFNVIYLLNVALAGFGMFLLARKLTQRPMESFLAGLIFMWSPFLVTRGQAHFSLVAAAPLPIFLLVLHRAWETRRLRDAALTGGVVAWAAFCDPYYAVYCLMLGGCFLASRVFLVSWTRRSARDLRLTKRPLTMMSVGLAGLILVVRALGGGAIALGPLRVSMRSMYTPMLLLTIFVVARLLASSNVRIRLTALPSRKWLLRSAIASGFVAAVFMSPVLSALGSRMVAGGMVATPVLWRSSAPGVDLLSFLIPNPNHALAPAGVVKWLTAGPGGYVDQVASLSLVGLLLILCAWRFASLRLPRFWLIVTAGFALLTLGPFITIGRVETLIPTPWALLRYVPVIGAARMPARFDAVVTLGFCVLVAMALVALVDRFPARRRAILGTIGVLLAFELFPAPRTLYSAAVPRVYEAVAADPRPVRVLRLPTGIRDGLSSKGNFGAQTQYYQTFHGKGLIGGYLSRVDESEKAFYSRLPTMSALMELSEGRPLQPGKLNQAVEGADEFIRSANVGYVVWRTERVSRELRDFATTVFGLTKVTEADGYELYVPRNVN